MKSLMPALVVASLVLNATLLAAIVKRSSISGSAARGERPTVSPGSAAATVAQSGAGTGGGAAVEVDPGGGHSRAVTSAPLWEQLMSHDPATFAANLRSAGFSLGSTRGAVYALLRDLQTPERVKAMELLPAEPYWKPARSFSASSEYSKEISRLWHERDRIMRSIFPEEQEAFVLRMQARFGPLSADKLEKLAVLDRDYSEMRMQLMQSSSALRMPWSTDKLTYLEQERRRDIAAILTPQELEDYQLRDSTTARMLQRQLASFEPSEQEYRELFRLRAAFEEKTRASGAVGFGAPESLQAQKELSEQIKSTLGEKRYADYERSTDPGVQSANSIAQRLGLPASTATAVYELQQEMRAREAALQADRALPEAQRAAQLAALGEEARQKLTTLLTASGVDQYRLETGGRGLPILERANVTRR